MKNYIREAKKINVHIYGDKYLQKYRINKTSKYTKLYYMDGSFGFEQLENITDEDLQQRQREDLRIIENKVKEKTKSDITFNSSISTFHFLTGTLLSILRNTAAPVWLTYSGYFLLKALRPIRLRKDIALAGWIYDNRDKVNEVIKEEVDEKREPVSENIQTNNMMLGKYPKDLVPYSEEMYDNGINLNNIDELEYKTLKKLKRKVLRKERKNKND